MGKTLLEYRQEAAKINSGLMRYSSRTDSGGEKDEAKASSSAANMAKRVGGAILSTSTNPFLQNIGRAITMENDLQRIAPRVGDTLQHIGDSVKEGAFKSVEGVFDYLFVSQHPIVTISRLFDGKIAQKAADFIERDHVGEWFDKDYYRERRQQSYMKEGGFGEELAQGVGGMLPSVAVAFATGGSSAVAQASSLLTTGLGAAGNATEQALGEGASLGQAKAYGAAIGGIEAATEKLVGRGLDKLYGSGFFDNIIPIGDWAKTGIGRYAANAVGEGFEEALTELADPLAKTIYKGKDALEDYTDLEYWKGVGKAGLSGAAISSIYGGAFDVMGGGVKAGDVDSLMRDVAAAETKGQNLQNDNRLDEATEAKLKSQTLGDFKAIENILKNLPESKRAEIIESRQLSDRFEADGSLKNTLDGDGNLEYNKSYISYTARGSAQRIADTLSDMSADVAEKYAKQNNVDIETAKAQVGEFKLYNQELTENGNKTFTKFKKALSYLNKLGDSNVKFAVVEPNSSFNGALKDGVLYVGADTFENGKWAGTLVHEYMHFEEGTAEYDALVKHLESDNALLDSALASVSGKAYGFDGAKLDAIIKKANSGEGIIADERKYYASFKGEVSAHMGEMLLGSEAFIDNLVAMDGNLAQKVVAKIKSLKAMFERLGNAKASAEYKFIKKAENLYLKAAEKAGDARLIRYITSGEWDEDEAQYARKHAQHIPYEIAGNPIYETLETRKPIDPINNAELKKIREKSVKEFGLDENQASSLKSYVMGLAYMVNKKLNLGNIVDGDISFIDNLTEALQKFPVFEGRTYRNLKFKNEHEYNAFLEDNSINNIVQLKAFTSTSKKPNGYPLFGEYVVHMVFDGVSGRDIADTYGVPRQQEVLFLPGTQYIVNSISKANDGNILIFVKESVTNEVQNDDGNHESRGFELERDAGSNRAISKGKEYDNGRVYRDGRGSGNSQDVRRGKVYSNVNGYTIVNDTKKSGSESFVNLTEKNTQFSFKENSDNNKNTAVGGGVDIKAESLYNNNAPFSKKDTTAQDFEAIKRKMQEVMERFSLAEDEAWAVIKYKTAEAYKINAKLRDGVTPLNAIQEKIVRLLDSALEKLPKHKGKVYRTVSFDDLFNSEEEYNTFLEEHSEGNFVAYNAYTSTSAKADGHPVPDDTKYGVTLEIECENGRDIDGFGNNFENEVLYPRGFSFVVTEVSTDSNGRPHIKVKEIGEDVRHQRNSEERSNVLQQMRAESSVHGDLQEVSEQNTLRSGNTENSVQGVQTKKGQIVATSKFSLKENSDNNKKLAYHTKTTNEKLSAKERKLVERLDKAEEKVKEERQKREDAERYSKTANRVLKLVRDINNWKKGVFESAAEANGDVFKGIIGELSRIDIRGNVSPISARKAMKKLADWYGAADLYPIVQELKEAEIWSAEALDAMRAIGDEKHIEAQKPLSVAELQGIETVIRHLKHIVETYHRVFRAGKYVEAKPLAEDYIRIIGENAKIRVGRVEKLIDGKYNEYFGDPESLMKWHDRYNKDGFFTATFNELRDGALNMAIAQMQMRAELDDWLEKNPNFLKRLNNTTIEVEGIEMSRAEALSLYMTARREQAEGGLAVGGFEVRDAKTGKKLGVDGLVDKEPASAQSMNTVDNSKKPNSYTQADLEENAKAVVSSKEVAQLTGHEFERTGNEKLADKVVEFFNSIGNVAYNKELGEIALTKSSFRDDRAHGLTRNKVISFKAVPDVIEKGHVIDVYKPQGKPYERITIAAPIKIGTQKYYVGVMVQRDTQSQRMYLHDIIAEEATLSFTTEPTTQKSEGIRDEGHLFITSILQKVLSVKSEIQKNGDATYDMEKKIGLVGKLKDSLFGQFSESEKKYLDFVEKILNEDCKQRKERTDNILLGYSNTLEGFYYPIRRGHVAYTVGEDTLGAELGRIKSLSFNKDTVKGSKGRLFIEPINEVVDRHIAGIAMYENLSIAIDNFNRLFNLDISGNKNNPVTIAKAMEKEGGWAEAGKYIDKLIKDIEGIKSVDKWESKALGFIRSGFVRFQLGANPKTWVTQLSSLFASMSVLDPQYVGKAMIARVDGAELDEYSALAKLRNSENTAVLAQGVIDRMGKFGDILMKPIGATDRFVIKKLWYACQLQVEAEQKLKLGSESNKQAAAKLLEKVIFETQQNSLLTERSAAMRSSSELIKGFTMFSADAMKLTARIVDAYGRICVIKDKQRRIGDAGKGELDAELKDAVSEFKRASGSAVAVAVFMSLIAIAFSHLYGKRDDDETIAEKAMTFGADFAGNLLGGLPLIRDIYSYIADGYELNHYALSSINDLLSGVNGLFTLTSSWIGGKRITQQEIIGKTKAALFGLGQIFGVPLRNAYNVGRGVVGGVSLITGNGKSFGYAWDSFFYDKSYRSDLNKAIEAGDDKLVFRIAALMVGESFGGLDKPISDELRRLISTGADVLPRAVGDSITYDGEEYAFTLRQRKRFEDIYGTADEVLADMVKLTQYKTASDAVKARAIKFIYETYYDLATDDMLGVDSADKNVLFAEAIDIEKLAIIVAHARMITADVDKSGNVISGTKKQKIVRFIETLSLSAAQKHMILGYLGYKQKAGEEKVKAYINRLKLTSAEKKALLRYSGYVA